MCDFFTAFHSFSYFENTDEKVLDFKQESGNGVLYEKTTNEEGQAYLDYLKNTLNMSDNEILTFCNTNDTYGNPKKYEYSIGSVSAESLKHIFFANIILKYMETLNKSLDVVELIGGYGGLAMAIKHYQSKYIVTINSYSIIYMECFLNLQKKYHELNGVSGISYVNSSTFGRDIASDDLFMINMNCFCNPSSAYQQYFVKYLMPKVENGYVFWDSDTTPSLSCVKSTIDQTTGEYTTYNKTFTLTVETEYPINDGDLFLWF